MKKITFRIFTMRNNVKFLVHTIVFLFFHKRITMPLTRVRSERLVRDQTRHIFMNYQMCTLWTSKLIATISLKS